MKSTDALDLVFSSKSSGPIHDVIRFTTRIIYLLILCLYNNKTINDSDIEWMIKEIK